MIVAALILIGIGAALVAALLSLTDAPRSPYDH